MKRLFLYSLIALSSFVLPACGDDEDKKEDPQPALTKTELLTNKNWTLIERENVQGHVSVPGPWSTQPACIQDNFTKFETTGTYRNDEGATKCNSSAQQSVSGNWSFFDNENQMYIDQRPCQIIELSESKLEYKRTMVISGQTYIDIFRYEHK